MDVTNLLTGRGGRKKTNKAFFTNIAFGLLLYSLTSSCNLEDFHFVVFHGTYGNNG